MLTSTTFCGVSLFRHYTMCQSHRRLSKYQHTSILTLVVLFLRTAGPTGFYQSANEIIIRVIV